MLIVRADKAKYCGIRIDFLSVEPSSDLIQFSYLLSLSGGALNKSYASSMHSVLFARHRF